MHTNILSLSLSPLSALSLARSLPLSLALSRSRSLSPSLTLSRSLALKNTVAGGTAGATHRGGIKQLSMESVGPSFCVQLKRFESFRHAGVLV